MAIQSRSPFIRGRDAAPKAATRALDVYPRIGTGVRRLVSRAGLEPATLCLKGRCSNHLSYRPPGNFRADITHDSIGIAGTWNIVRELRVA